MRLKLLKLFGFKSFSRKTELICPAGITAIVGPNGSGKSNLVDALLWVLGEQRVRHLRSLSAAELLYSGNGQTKPASLAEVSLSLELDSHSFPNSSLLKGLTELVIARRLYRSGESHYFVNQVPFRHRDVRDLLLELGLSPDSYALVSQWEMDRLVRADPMERRAVLEQAAGVFRFQIRRQEILDNLAKTERNLVRLRDLLRELESQWLSLAEEIEKAKRYQRLHERSQWLKSALFAWDHLVRLRRLERLREERDQLSRQIAQLVEREQAISDELHRLEESLKRRDALIFQLQEELASLRDREKELENQRDRLRERLSFVSRWRQQTEETLSVLNDRKERIRAEFAQTEGHLQKIRSLLDDRRKQLLKLREEENRLRSQLVSLEEEQKRAQEDHFEAERSRSEIASRLQFWTPLKKTLTDRRDQLLKEKGEQERRLSETYASLQQAESALRLSEERSARLGQSRREREEEIKRLMSEDANLSGPLTDLEREIIALEAKKESLEAVGGEPEAMAHLWESISKALGDQEPRTVADCLFVPPDVKKAVETLLSAYTDYIVVERWDQAISLLPLLERSPLMPSGLFVLEGVRDGSLTALNPPSSDSIWNRITVTDERLRYLLMKVTGDAVIAEETAYPISTRSPFLLTPSGQKVAPWGLIEIHRERKETPAQRWRQRQELQRRLQELQGERDQKAADRQKLLSRIRQESDALKELEEEERREQDQIQKERDRTASLKKEIERLTSDGGRIEKEWERMERELTEIEEGMRRDQVLLCKAQERVHQKAEEVASLRRKREEIEGALRSTLEKAREAERELHRLRSEEARLEEQVRFLTESLKEVERERSQLLGAMEERRREGEQASSDLSHIEQQLESEGQKRYETEGHLKQVRRAQGADRDRVKMLSEERESVRSALDEKKEESHRLELRWSQTEAEEEELRRRLTEEFQTDIEDAHRRAEALDQKQSALSELESLKAQMEEIGPVSLSVLEEDRRLQERISFLRAQIDDLEKGMAILQDNLQKVEERFAEQFVKILEEVSEAFNRILDRFWDGASGSLRLTEGESLAERGAQLHLRIPGKPERELMALSGGEKAIVGICLLFALLTVCPVPFAVLDEVDAALDDQNSEHFCRLLTDFAERTQFLVVTHNALTVQAADHLYGVTLREDGSSQVLSLSLKEALAWATES